MITYFSMAGFLSVKDRAEVYFVPRPHTRITNTRFEDNFIQTSQYKLMKAVILFGINASGKTNFLAGLQHLISIINHGLNLGAVDDSRRSLINFDCNQVSFEIGLYDDRQDRDYVYKVTYNTERILGEELSLGGQVIYSFSSGQLHVADIKEIKDREAIMRLFSGNSTELYLIKLHDYMGDYIRDFRELAAAVRVINIKDVVPLLGRDNIRIINGKQKSFWEEQKDGVIKVFQMLDPTITSVGFEKWRTDMYEVVIYRGNRKYHFGMESKGLQKICHLMDSLLRNMVEGGVLAVDELDSSISTISLLELFNGLINTPQNKGQFLITSHNPFLMNQNIFQPQQLYVANKKMDLSTEVYSFDEFDLRNDKNKLYEDYLKGRFGGIGG